MKYRLITLMVMLLVGCSFFPKPLEIESINLSQQAVSLALGDTEYISFQPFPARSSMVDIEIEIDNPIALVERTRGVISITGIAPGKGIITLSSKGAYASISVEVQPQSDSYLQTNRSSLFLDPGEISQISSSLVNGTISPNEYVWVSHNDKVAQIVGLGPSVSVVAHAPGETIVECIIPALGLQTTIAIVVGGYSLDLAYSQIGVSEEQPIQILGEGRGIHGFLWRVDDESVATVTGVGASALLVGVSSGITRFYAEHRDLGITLEGVIRIVGNTPSIYFSPGGYIVKQGDSLYLQAIVDSLTPLEASQIEWSSSSQSVSIVGTGERVLIDAVSQGTSMITATHPKLNISGKVEVVVKKMEYFISISKTLMVLHIGALDTLTVDTDEDPSRIVWSVDDPSILTITTNRNSATLLAKKPGVATITASLPDGSSAQCQVTTQYEPSISLSVQNASLQPGDQVELTAHHNQPGTSILWRVSDSTMGSLSTTVGDTVTFTSLKEGTCTVIATLTQGSKQITAEAIINSLYRDVSISVKITGPDDDSVIWEQDDRLLKMNKYTYAEIEIIASPSHVDLGPIRWEANLNDFGTLVTSNNGKKATITKSIVSVSHVKKSITIKVDKYDLGYGLTVRNM